MLVNALFHNFITSTEHHTPKINICLMKQYNQRFHIKLCLPTCLPLIENQSLILRHSWTTFLALGRHNRHKLSWPIDCCRPFKLRADDDALTRNTHLLHLQRLGLLKVIYNGMLNRSRSQGAPESASYVIYKS